MTKEPALDALTPSTPSAIRHLLRRCIEKDPKRRLQAIGEARIALEDPLASVAPSPSSAVAGAPVARSRGLRRLPSLSPRLRWPSYASARNRLTLPPRPSW